MWKKFYDSYLKEIIEIEKPDRDDVFKKSMKFDRPDYSSHIPFEIFNALNRLHNMNQNQKDTSDDNKQPAITEDAHDDGEEDHKPHEDIELHEPEIEQHTSEDGEEQPHTEDKENAPDHHKSTLPTEFDIIKANQESIHHQVINTTQEDDLKKDQKHEIVDVPLEPSKDE